LTLHVAAVSLLAVMLGGASAPDGPRAVPTAVQKVLPEAAAPARPTGLWVSGRHFLDASGRVVILRGINLTGDSKVPPFLPRLTDADFGRLEALGMNVVRLLFIWEAYEPAPGCYDESYLAGIRAIAEAAWRRGMHVIVDIHQDGFSRFASRGSGDGFPCWAVSARCRPSTPDNGPRCKNWPMLMATDPKTHRSFADFFTDAAGVRTHYLQMLSRIAATFAETPGVIGYDLMNEPWGDERRDLAPLYADAASVLRARHPSSIIFVEGHVTTNCGHQTKLPRPQFGGVAYAPHFYKPSTIVLKRWNGSTHTARHGFANMAAKAVEWDVPLFLGEFGVAAGTGNAGDYIEDLYDRLDACLASGAQWNYTPGWNPCTKDGWNGEDFNILDACGRPRPNFRPRPYPRHTAGLPVHFEYRSAGPAGIGRTLTFTWEHDPGRGDTEIFVPDPLFPRGSALSVQPADVACWKDEARQLLVVRGPTAATISVRLTAGSIAVR
jgi:endoglycosylceramidase